jgi:hypothetical protein
MGFNNYGLYFIWNDEQIRVSFTDGFPGKDFGAHWLMADPVDVSEYPHLKPAAGELSVGDFTKSRVHAYEVSFEPGGGGYRGLGVVYQATVTNRAGYAQWFTLQGGGNT